MTVSQVRVLTSDLALYERSTATGDGVTMEFQVEQYPVIADTENVYVDGSIKSQGTDYTIDNEVGLITFTAAPGDGMNIIVTYRHAILSDAQIESLIDLESNVRLAAALALDTIASNEALVQKKIRLLDIQTDGPAVAKELRAHATALRKQVTDAAALDEASAFDIAEMVFPPFGPEEALYNRALRGEI